jgi:hypothetical protein
MTVLTDIINLVNDLRLQRIRVLHGMIHLQRRFEVQLAGALKNQLKRWKKFREPALAKADAGFFVVDR